MTFKGLSKYADYVISNFSAYRFEFVENYAKPGNRVWEFNSRYHTSSSFYSIRNSIPAPKLELTRPSRTSRSLVKWDLKDMGLYKYHSWRSEELARYYKSGYVYFIGSYSLSAPRDFVLTEFTKFTAIFGARLCKMKDPNQGIFSCPYGIGVK